MLLYTGIAILACEGLVLCIILHCSRKAIDPLVQASIRQKQFITDAGHELKTPITVIASDLKRMEMEKGENRWSQMALAQTEKLTELVNALVPLSKTDEEDFVCPSLFCISKPFWKRRNRFGSMPLPGNIRWFWISNPGRCITEMNIPFGS